MIIFIIQQEYHTKCDSKPQIKQSTQDQAIIRLKTAMIGIQDLAMIDLKTAMIGIQDQAIIELKTATIGRSILHSSVLTLLTLVDLISVWLSVRTELS